MLTRVLFALALACVTMGSALADDATLLKLGIADHEVNQGELEAGTPPVPRFNTPAIAYALLANLKKGDIVEVSLNNEKGPLLTNSKTLEEDQPALLLQAGKRGVPAGGWPPDWKYFAKVTVTRDGKPMLEQASETIPFPQE